MSEYEAVYKILTQKSKLNKTNTSAIVIRVNRK